jgi:hypothetical protein
MKRMNLGINFTVFLLFFGLATLEAFRTRSWINAAFWLAIGAVFLVADNLRKRIDGSPKKHSGSLGGN